MLYRAQVRTTALELLTAAITQAGAQKTSSKDTPVPSGKTPSIVVYTDDVKEGDGGSPPQFKTTVLTTVEVVAEGKTKDEAEALLDALCETVEDALLGGIPFVKLFEKLLSVETKTDYRGIDTKLHSFIGVIEIKGQVTEIFEPTITTDLGGMNIYVDSVNIFDPNGNYGGQEPFQFPDAPRTSGPDGRPEISGSVGRPQVQNLATEAGDEIQTEDGATITTE
jgi:hypothetical protein